MSLGLNVFTIFIKIYVHILIIAFKYLKQVLGFKSKKNIPSMR